MDESEDPPIQAAVCCECCDVPKSVHCQSIKSCQIAVFVFVPVLEVVWDAELLKGGMKSQDLAMARQVECPMGEVPQMFYQAHL